MKKIRSYWNIWIPMPDIWSSYNEKVPVLQEDDVTAYDVLDSESIRKYILSRWDKDLTIMIPCYNEEGNIIETFDVLIPVLQEMPFDWEIIVIDDASEDKSRDLIRRYMDEHADCRITLKVRKENAGLAQNYVDGAFLARGKYYKMVHADNSEPRETLEKIFDCLGKADLVLPYHIRAEGKSFFRRTLSKIYTFLVNLMTGYNIKYYNGLGLSWTYNVMRWHTGYNGFCFQADIVTRSIEDGATYVEIPIISQERKTGVSKALKLMNWFSTAHFFMDLIIRRIAHLYDEYERKARRT